MPRELKKIAFILEEFAVPSPGQQLLDRFLLGYPAEGGFHQLSGCQVIAHAPWGAGDGDLNRRATDLSLRLAKTPAEAVADADGIVVVWRGVGAVANDAVLRSVLANARPGAACFVYGRLASGLEAARAMIALAASRQINLLSGTALGVTWRLPETALERGARIDEALIVVQGPAPGAEFEGLEGLLPVIEGRRGGEKGVRRARWVVGAEVWRAGEKGEWSWPLLAAAISRSDSPQGDPVKDGRTQNLVGLGLVPKLARSPRAWLVEHRDGLRSAVLCLDGVVADLNFAVRKADGGLVSAQIYRPPPPAQHEFSRLAGKIEGFFTTGHAPWAIARGELIAGLMSALNAKTQGGQGAERGSKQR
jgi:hypothetical protein